MERFKRLNLTEKIIVLAVAVFLIVLVAHFIESIALLAFFLVPIATVFAWIAHNSRRRDALRQDYQNKLEELSKQPQNSRLRTACLDAGRTYYASLRDGQLSIYDEQAIANDLSTILGTEPNNQ